MFGFNRKGKENNFEQENTEEHSQAEEKPSFILGVLDVFSLKDSPDFIVVGRVKGTVHKGDTVYLSNPGTDDDRRIAAVVTALETGPGAAALQAADCDVALRIKNGSRYPLRKGTVLFTEDKSDNDIHTVYINTLGDVFVMKQGLDLSDEDLGMLTIADCAESWRMFFWLQGKVAEKQSQEERQEARRRIDRLADALCRKILHAEAIYCIYDKTTGEPYLLSRTIKREENYECTPPDILIFPKSYQRIMRERFPEERFEIRRIENGEKGDGIYNFLGTAFYLNGACGAAVLSEQTAIAAGMLVPEPDYSQTPQQNIPVTNPGLVRWALLLGQIGEARGEDADLIRGLYYGFLSRELLKARLLIPMQNMGEIPKTDESGKTILQKDTTMKFPTKQGKYGRPAVCIFTDWKRLRMVYGKDWNALVQPVEGIIDVFDCAVNSTEFYRAGFYVSKDMFEEIKGKYGESGNT